MICFGPFQVDVRRRALLHGGRRIHLTAKTFDLLLYLAHNHGRLIDKDELLSAVWPDSAVEESNLTVTISMLRRALAGSCADDRFIITIPKRGYRFTPTVTGLDVASASPVSDAEAPLRWRGTKRARLSIAVLRLRSVGAECPDGLADSVVDGIVSHLLRETVTVFQTPENGNEDPIALAHRTGARATLEGTIERCENQIRVRVRLVRVTDRKVLWADEIDESVKELLAMEDAIAFRVTSALLAWMRSDEQANAAQRDGRISAANQAYRKGLYFFEKRTEGSLRRGIACFEEATTRDPKYAAAYLGVADSYFLLCYYGMLPPKIGYPKTRTAAMRALDLAPGLGLAHTTLACVHLFYEWDSSLASDAFLKGIELCPNEPRAYHWYSEYLRATGQFEAAIVAMQRACERDPLSLMINTSTALVYFYARRNEAAAAELQRVLEMDPYFAVAYWSLGLAYGQQSRHGEAIKTLRKAVMLSQRNSLMLGTLGYAYGRAGRRQEAKRALEELRELSRTQFVSAYSVALVYVGLDDKAHAITCLRKALAERAGWLAYIHVNPMLDGLRSDTRFKALARRVGVKVAPARALQAAR